MPVAPSRLLRWLEVDRPALVLGSTQQDSLVDRDACARLGIDVVRRSSGGGAVLLRPGHVVWLDVVLPVDDPLWEQDIGRSAGWLGRAWATALGSLGVPDAEVHAGRMVRTTWSPLVCFAGLGPGEVAVAGSKVVGIAQRRTRAGAVFQCALPLEWDAADLAALFVLAPDERHALAHDLTGAVLPLRGVAVGDIEEALVAALP